MPNATSMPDAETSPASSPSKRLTVGQRLAMKLAESVADGASHSAGYTRSCYTRSSHVRNSWALHPSATAALIKQVPDQLPPQHQIHSHLRFAHDGEEEDEEEVDMDAMVSAQTVAPAINARLHEERSFRGESIHLAALSMSKRGYCICRGGLSAEIVREAAREAAVLFGAGKMSRGNFTIGGDESIVANKREDHIVRLHSYLNDAGGPEHADANTLLSLDGVLHGFGEAVCNAMARLDRPHEPLGRAPDGGRLHYTGRTDSMVSCYPGEGARYGPHIDNFDGDGRQDLDFGRCFTVLYYMNDPEWDQEADGGALRIHLLHEADDDADTHPAIDILPRGDTLVMFRADRILHEVRPARKERFAISMWLYGGSEEHQAAWRDEGANVTGRG
jgi:hypothetical protein